jgi:alkanesulfonate monooxygenase SsuD/methylene tetrahydromethanopterin reductase-like flavin-dependent oxidoreductase (luciferase family)
VTFAGTEVQLDQAALVHPPQQPPLISLGVRGAKSLALSGRVADGTILAEYAAPEYVAWAREQIKTGQQEVGRNSPHRLTVFAFTCVDNDAAAAYRQLRPLVASAIVAEKIDVYLAPLGILPQAQKLMENGGKPRLEAEMPDEWLDKLAIVGKPEECIQSIHRLVEAGADSVVLAPLPGKSLSELEVFTHFKQEFLS